MCPGLPQWLHFCFGPHCIQLRLLVPRIQLRLLLIFSFTIIRFLEKCTRMRLVGGLHKLVVILRPGTIFGLVSFQFLHDEQVKVKIQKPDAPFSHLSKMLFRMAMHPGVRPLYLSWCNSTAMS